MFKVTGNDLRKVSMDVYYLFGRDLQIQFKKGKPLPQDALWFTDLSDKAKNHIKSTGHKIRKVKSFNAF